MPEPEYTNYSSFLWLLQLLILIQLCPSQNPHLSYISSSIWVLYFSMRSYLFLVRWAESFIAVNGAFLCCCNLIIFIVFSFYVWGRWSAIVGIQNTERFLTNVKVIKFYCRYLIVPRAVLDKMKTTRMDSNVSDSIFDQYFQAILSKYFSWSMQPLAVPVFVVNRTAKEAFNVT